MRLGKGSRPSKIAKDGAPLYSPLSMSELYPLLMTPLFDPRPWGTHDLAPIYPQQFKEKIGESWLTGDHCKVQNGGTSSCGREPVSAAGEILVSSRKALGASAS